MYVVWGYDQYPYFLVDEIVSFDETDSSKVYVKHYNGYRFKYNTLLPDDRGEKLVKLREKLNQGYRKQQDQLLHSYHMALATILKNENLTIVRDLPVDQARQELTQELLDRYD